MTNVTELRSNADLARSERARWIHGLLTDERWSITKAAVALGMPKSTLAGRLRGDNDFLASEIGSIAELLKLNAGRFFEAYLAIPSKTGPSFDELSGRGGDANLRPTD